MKKLMIAMAVVASAIAVNAATVTWGASALKTPASADGGNSTTAAKATVSGSLYLLTADQYNTFLAAYNDDGNMKAVYDYFTTGAGKDATASKTGKSSSLTSALNLTSDAAVGDTVYGAVIYTTTATFDGEAKDFYIANIATGTVGAESGLNILNLGTVFLGADPATGTATGGWQSVPEPTSGLLLLLGVAGLALKRKRA